MNAITQLTEQFRKLGYPDKALPKDYRFADMLLPDAPQRVVPLAVFTDTPPSYRNAAFGVLTGGTDTSAQVRAHRALGAGIWFCIQADQVEVWSTRDAAGPVREAVHPLAELDLLFERNRQAWAPDRIHQAKLAGLWDVPEQGSLFEANGLLKLIEVHTQGRLDRVITRTLKTLATPLRAAASDYRRAYRACFYFVAAKIILDRGHPVGKNWPIEDAAGILDAITVHYGLEYATEPGKGIARQRLEEAWGALRDDVSFANISADDLAFVYENTLVSEATRQELGTHSTPRAVAEFLISRLDLGRHGKDAPKIYEPFCGAGVLLVAALAKIRNSLPREWTEAQRHAFLVKRLRGADVDPFACEVASLSLVLADYPSSNGWDIRTTDLFSKDALASQLESGMVVVCNPPFEKFTLTERMRYPDASSTSVHKPIQVLDTILDKKPSALAFVMPHAVIADSQYVQLRQRIERQFGRVELVSLPDRVFVQADFESALLVACDPRPKSEARMVAVCSATVTDAEREDFLAGCHRPVFRNRDIWSIPTQEAGNLWVPELAELWDWLANCPTLGSIAELHRGLEWKSGYQTQAMSHAPKAGYKPGLHSSRNLTQFAAIEPAYLDCRQGNLRGGAMALPWDRPKVIFNAARKSRGAWRLAATADSERLVFSQQLAGAWPKESGDAWLFAIEALMNSPLASAYVTVFNPRKGFRLEVLEGLPIPHGLDPQALRPLIDCVHQLTRTPRILSISSDDELTAALLALDAAILSAYDLPPRLERRLLAYFKEAKRPLEGVFGGYPDDSGGMARTLAEMLAGQFDDTRGAWIRDAFRPLPANECESVGSFFL